MTMRASIHNPVSARIDRYPTFFTIVLDDRHANCVTIFLPAELADRISRHVEAINDIITGRDPIDDLVLLADAPSIAERDDGFDDGNITD